MALLKQCLKCSCNLRRRIYQVSYRSKSITGYETADQALQKVTGGRIYRWLDAYEDFVGLTEVRAAQESVTKAEAAYRKTQEKRRTAQQKLTEVQNKIKALAIEIEKAKRGTDAYLELVTKENEIIKEEKEYLENQAQLEETEKNFFALFSSAVRESHEKERARAERMKYWGIMGSVIGAVVGILGTSVNNYYRMKELRNIVTTLTEMNKVHTEKTLQLSVGVNEQYRKISQSLTDIRAGIQHSDGTIDKTIATSTQKPFVASDAKLDEIKNALHKQEVNLDIELKKIGQVLAAREGKAVDGTVVYVGPEVQSMFWDTEKNLEWKMKLHALGTVTMVYAVAALAVPIFIKFFGGT